MNLSIRIFALMGVLWLRINNRLRTESVPEHQNYDSEHTALGSRLLGWWRHDEDGSKRRPFCSLRPRHCQDYDNAIRKLSTIIWTQSRALFSARDVFLTARKQLVYTQPGVFVTSLQTANWRGTRPFSTMPFIPNTDLGHSVQPGLEDPAQKSLEALSISNGTQKNSKGLLEPLAPIIFVEATESSLSTELDSGKYKPINVPSTSDAEPPSTSEVSLLSRVTIPHSNSSYSPKDLSCKLQRSNLQLRPRLLSLHLWIHLS